MKKRLFHIIIIKAFTSCLLILALSQSTWCLEFPREALVKNAETQLRLNAIKVNQDAIYTYFNFDIREKMFHQQEIVSFSVNSDKRPATALIIAFFPGFFIHGLGHYYIGEKSTGTRLLIAEAISVVIFYYSVVGEVASLENRDGENKKNDLARGVSLALFFGSWVYDFIAAPLKVKKTNLLNRMSLIPEISNTGKTIMVSLCITANSCSDGS